MRTPSPDAVRLAARAGGWLLLALFTVPAASQDADAGASVEQPLGSRRGDLGDERERPASAPATPAGGGVATPEGNPDIHIFVRQFSFTGNTLIEESRLRALAAPYEGRIISDVELQALRRALNQLYADAGYVTSGFVIPDQDIDDGVVTLEAVEGRLRAVEVAGAVGFDAEFLRQWIAEGIGSPIRLQELQDHLYAVAQDPGIGRLEPQLVVDRDQRSSVLRVNIVEAPRFGARVGFANDRSPAVGGYRGELELAARNLLGRGDTTTIALEGGDGLRIIDARTDVPLNVHGTRLQFRVADYDTDIVEEPLDALDIESESRIVEVGLMHAFIRTPARTVHAGVSLDGRDSESFLSGIPFSFNPGAERGEASVRAVRLKASWLERAGADVFALQAIVSVGVDALGATVHHDDRPDSEFESVLVAGQWLHAFGLIPGQFYGRAQAQVSDDALLPLEKFSVGGLRSVRGYRRGRLIRDSGWDATVEYRLPVATLPVPALSDDGEGRVSAVFFVDAGRAWNEDNGKDARNRTLMGAGPGVRWDVSRGLRAEFYWAAYQRDLDFEKTDPQDHGLHFQVGYRTDF